MKKKILILIIPLLLVLILYANAAGKRNIISKDQLIDDVNQLKEFIELVHPDPYINSGGERAFDNLYQEILKSIPDEGMSKEEFYILIAPLVASVDDSHTWLRPPFSGNPYSPGGIPLYFDIVEDDLYVLGVAKKEMENLIGHKLISIEGVTLEGLVKRCNKLMGADNDYLLLRNLAGAGKLWYRSHLESILPEWDNKKQIKVALQSTDGEIIEHILDIPKLVSYPLTSPGSKFELPSREKCDFVYQFLDDKKETALLVIDGMMTYREAFEMWISFGNADAINDAKDQYKRYNGKKAPEDVDEILNGVPSATEIFKNLVVEMKEAGTKNLLIDLRRNDGGNSFMYNILIYYLYGKEKLIEIKQKRYEVEKYSSIYFERNPNIKESDISAKKGVIVTDDGGYLLDSKDQMTKDFVLEELKTEVSRTPTFKTEFEKNNYNGYYKPENVIVLSEPNTFSSGFTMMYYLYRAGAKIVGTPSSQSGNCFGDILSFKLKNSGLSGNVSHKKFVYFPENEELGKILTPHYQLTYKKLASYNFDMNSEILFALDLLKQW